MTKAQFAEETSAGGRFVRQPNRFTGRVSARSRSPLGGGPDEQGRIQVDQEITATNQIHP